jgi:hypothetical protein
MSPPRRILPAVSRNASLNPKTYSVANPIMLANPNRNQPTENGIRASKEWMAVASASSRPNRDSFLVLSVTVIC